MSSHLKHIQALTRYAEQLGQYNVGRSGWAVARNLCSIVPKNRDATEFEIQFVDRKSWIQFVKYLQAIILQEGWTARRIVRMVADGVTVKYAYCCAVHVGPKYKEQSGPFHEWVYRLQENA